MNCTINFDLPCLPWHGTSVFISYRHPHQTWARHLTQVVMHISEFTTGDVRKSSNVRYICIFSVDSAPHKQMCKKTIDKSLKFIIFIMWILISINFLFKNLPIPEIWRANSLSFRSSKEKKPHYFKDRVWNAVNSKFLGTTRSVVRKHIIDHRIYFMFVLKFWIKMVKVKIEDTVEEPVPKVKKVKWHMIYIIWYIFLLEEIENFVTTWHMLLTLFITVR